MNFDFSTSTIPELLTGAVVGLIGLTIGFKKLLTMFASEKIAVAKIESELEVINLLREQVHELTKANRELRSEIEQLRKLNSCLIEENDKIKREIRLLSEYVNTMPCLEKGCEKKPASQENQQELPHINTVI